MFQSPERIHAFGNREYPNKDARFEVFQSPERIHAFGNRPPLKPHGMALSFNPQRGFMLLGTWQYFMLIGQWVGFNPQRGFMLLGTTARTGTSAYGGFQSPERIHAFGNLSIDARFAPLEIVSIPREDSCFWELPPIHVDISANLVSIPREDSCFWEHHDAT